MAYSCAFPPASWDDAPDTGVERWRLLNKALDLNLSKAWTRATVWVWGIIFIGTNGNLLLEISHGAEVR